NAFAPWIGLGLVLLLGIGNLMRWKSGKIDDPVCCLLFPLLWAALLCITLVFHMHLDIKSALIFFIVLWTMGILILDLVFKIRQVRWNIVTFLKYNRPYLGAFFIHIGFLLAIA